MLRQTAGHATSRSGAYNLVKFAVDEVVKPSGETIRVDWHGHNDRGLAVANSLAAIAGGANQVHAAANSLGEPCGNTAMELMLVNLRLMGSIIGQDLSRLREYCERVALATIPASLLIIRWWGEMLSVRRRVCTRLRSLKRFAKMIRNWLTPSTVECPHSFLGWSRSSKSGP